VDGVVIEISNASQEQSSGLGQISTALNVMEQMTQANAARAREASNTVSQLTDQSNVLMRALHELHKIVFAHKRNVPVAPKAEPPVAKRNGASTKKRTPVAALAR